MARYFIFQVNPGSGYRLSDALKEMQLRKEKTLWLSPKPDTNTELKCKHVVCLWESGKGLVARGEITQAADKNTPRDMPVWQRVFCIDETTRYGGPQFHKAMPRAEVEIEKFAERERVNREQTNDDPVLRENVFLKKHGFYNRTIFDLTNQQAQALDKLAGS